LSTPENKQHDSVEVLVRFPQTLVDAIQKQYPNAPVRLMIPALTEAGLKLVDVFGKRRK
jgi:hypothetical protein